MPRSLTALFVLGLSLSVRSDVLFLDDSPTVASSTNLPVGNWSGTYHEANTTGTGVLVSGVSFPDANDPGDNSSRLFIGTPSGPRDAMLFTPEAAFNTAVTASQIIEDWEPASWSISYWMRNDNNPTTRLALKVDTVWYVRETASTNLGSNGNGWTEYQVLNPFGASDWTVLDFTPGSLLERDPLTGPSTSLPGTGTLNGIGVWGTGNANYGMRLDLVEIQAVAVPEPATLALLAIGLGLAAAVRRR